MGINSRVCLKLFSPQLDFILGKSHEGALSCVLPFSIELTVCKEMETQIEVRFDAHLVGQLAALRDGDDCD